MESTAPHRQEHRPWMLHAKRARVPTSLAFAVWASGLGLLVLLVGAVDEPTTALPPTRPTVRAPIEMRDAEGRIEQTREHLRATLPWSNSHSVWGWGNVRFSAEPRMDEIGVITIVDAPRTARLWTSRCEVRFFVDGEEARVRAEPVGSRMTTGEFFDALRMEIGIDVLRRMSRAEEVHGDLCGEPFALPMGQRETLRSFVDAFDGMAMPAPRMEETEVESAPVDPDEIADDPDTFLESV